MYEVTCIHNYASKVYYTEFSNHTFILCIKGQSVMLIFYKMINILNLREEMNFAFVILKYEIKIEYCSEYNYEKNYLLHKLSLLFNINF